MRTEFLGRLAEVVNMIMVMLDNMETAQCEVERLLLIVDQQSDTIHCLRERLDLLTGYDMPTEAKGHPSPDVSALTDESRVANSGDETPFEESLAAICRKPCPICGKYGHTGDCTEEEEVCPVEVYTAQPRNDT